MSISDQDPEPAAPKKRGPHGSTTELVTRELRQLIQSGHYSPGEHLLQSDIAEQMEISRIPVREALMILTTDGVVSHKPNQGYFVPKITAMEMHQIYVMRYLLESELLNNVRWPSEDELAEIHAIQSRLVTAIENMEFDAIMLENRAFHFAIFSLCDFGLIQREIKRLWDRSDGYRRSLLNTSPILNQVIEEHGNIIEALESKDEAALIEQMATHHKSGRSQLEKLIEKSR
ncbi:MAG: GntR family transcriptional regulator [Alphaproteobacteria bacterium]|jgi:DNA-binding GntR family transcriptional regulator|nr:GntR family transcriptional regulator [Alphaproteobacteria bacterium]MBT4082775.1 GntR family transcriptional regulator [Alphaproteobacteria bacterium]MBT4544004.1 GntR family transcriptional regulator [Alphaproteobacteria bacterium]MBT7745191.1 GntR family transcriptional regulator [Alphaproteobacteria bacterium]